MHNVPIALICYDEPINSRRPSHRSLFPSILRTNRQVLAESRPILYSDNVFSIEICEYDALQRAYSLNCSHFGEDAQDTFKDRLLDMRRFDISVLDDDLFPRVVKAAVRAVCKVLSEIPTLEYLRIEFKKHGGDSRSNPRILASFTLLRNVQDVDLEGVSQVYTQNLTHKMTGSSPLDHLRKMYEALEFYADPFDCYEEGL